MISDELDKLRRLKDHAEAVGRDKKASDDAFKQHQLRCLDLLEQAKLECARTDGVLYTAVADKVKGSISDRAAYVRWALEQDEGLAEWFANSESRGEFDALVETLLNLELVTLKEQGNTINEQARAHVEDEVPLPPGLNWRPEPYIQMHGRNAAS